jgi:hypothetical protein
MKNKFLHRLDAFFKASQIISDIRLGHNKYKSIPLISDKVNLMVNNPISRVLRVIGGICFILTIGDNISSFTTIKVIIITVKIIGTIFMGYYTIFNIYRVFRIYKILKKNRKNMR